MCGLGPGLALYAQGSVEHWGGGFEGETMKTIYLTSCKPRFPFPWTYEAYQADLQLLERLKRCSAPAVSITIGCCKTTEQAQERNSSS